MSTHIPPLKFEPILKSVVWGGEKIATFKGIVTEQTQIGESWEISGVKGNESVVANGPDKGLTLSQMIDKYKGDLVGEKNYEIFGNTFPLLIKIIDAAGNLSVQVHPDDTLAKERHNSLGKTEMWYIIDADKDAEIYAGLSKKLTPEEYAAKVADNSIMDSIAAHKSHAGDVFFLPAGRIHAIGAGNLLVEVQETSDITYRIYDYGRVDAKTGQPRELHVELAKDAIDYKVYPEYVSHAKPIVESIHELVRCSHFQVYMVEVEGEKTIRPSIPGFSTMTCIEGEMMLNDMKGTEMPLRQGESVLIPASLKEFKLTGKGKLVNAFN